MFSSALPPHTPFSFSNAHTHKPLTQYVQTYSFLEGVICYVFEIDVDIVTRTKNSHFQSFGCHLEERKFSLVISQQKMNEFVLMQSDQQEGQQAGLSTLTTWRKYCQNLCHDRVHKWENV